MISEQDAGEAGLTQEAICKWAEDGQLHLIELEGGLSFICLNSVVERLLRDRRLRIGPGRRWRHLRRTQ